MKPHAPQTIVGFLFGLMLLAVGIGALIAPRTGSKMYGIQVEGAAAIAFVRAAGVRDLAIGVWLIALTRTSASRRVMGVSLLSLALIPVGDASLVFLSGSTNGMALALHTLSIPLLAAIGAWFLLRPGAAGSAEIR